MSSDPKGTYITRFEWTITYVTAVVSPTSPNSALFSEPFLINGTSASACLVFAHTHSTDQEFCSLFLKGKSADQNARGQAIYNFWIENKAGKRVGAQFERDYHLKRIGMVGVGHFARKSKVYKPSSFIKDDTIIIKCNVKYTVDGSKAGEDTKVISSGNMISGLALEYNQKHYYVPRYLLIMQSNYFKHLLESETTEARTGIIHIEDIGNDAMNRLVYFVNDGTFTANYDTLEEMYGLANRYESDQLKAECKSKYLSSTWERGLLNSLKMGFSTTIRNLNVTRLINWNDATIRNLVLATSKPKNGSSLLQRIWRLL